MPNKISSRMRRKLACRNARCRQVHTGALHAGLMTVPCHTHMPMPGVCVCAGLHSDTHVRKDAMCLLWTETSNAKTSSRFLACNSCQREMSILTDVNKPAIVNPNRCK